MLLNNSLLSLPKEERMLMNSVENIRLNEYFYAYFRLSNPPVNDSAFFEV